MLIICDAFILTYCLQTCQRSSGLSWYPARCRQTSETQRIRMSDWLLSVALPIGCDGGTWFVRGWPFSACSSQHSQCTHTRPGRVLLICFLGVILAVTLKPAATGQGWKTCCLSKNTLLWLTGKTLFVSVITLQYQSTQPFICLIYM